MPLYYFFATYIANRASKVTTIENCIHMKGGKYRPPDQVSQSKKEKKKENNSPNIYISVFVFVCFIRSSVVKDQLQFTGSPLLYVFNLHHSKETTQKCFAY